MLAHAAGWILLFLVSVVLLYSVMGGPIRYDNESDD